MGEGFQLAAAIAETSAHLANLALCEARLQLDGRYPWIVLIPRRAGLTELEQLTAAERTILMEEVVRAGEAVRAIGASSLTSSSSPSNGSPPASSTTTSPMTSAMTTSTSPHAGPWKPVEKLNVGCLGNVTSQLHVHVVGRRRDDPSWPSPVWGSGQPEAVTPEAVSIARHAALPWLESRPRSSGA
jgi:diadenosine tetraphosphate (Ap4A) HIT family hydrolase